MQRNRIEADRRWGSFLKRLESPEGYNNVPDDFLPERTTGSKKYLRENADNVDSELRRLEEDAMPEINKIYKSIDRTEQRASQSRVCIQRHVFRRLLSLFLMLAINDSRHEMRKKYRPMGPMQGARIFPSPFRKSNILIACAENQARRGASASVT